MTLKVKRLSDGQIFEVHKYLKDPEGIIHIWCNDWYGHHIVGEDCEIVNQPTDKKYPSWMIWIVVSIPAILLAMSIYHLYEASNK